MGDLLFWVGAFVVLFIVIRALQKRRGGGDRE